LFKIKVIINGTTIYPISSGEKLEISVAENNPKIIVTDGYHYTRPLELVFHQVHTYYFKVVCIIDNHQLAVGIAMIIICYLLGFATGFFVVKLFSFFPIVYFLFIYYINRKDFLQLRAA
jgi:hypothetical protein